MTKIKILHLFKNRYSFIVPYLWHKLMAVYNYIFVIWKRTAYWSFFFIKYFYFCRSFPFSLQCPLVFPSHLFYTIQTSLLPRIYCKDPSLSSWVSTFSLKDLYDKWNQVKGIWKNPYCDLLQQCQCLASELERSFIRCVTVMINFSNTIRDVILAFNQVERSF